MPDAPAADLAPLDLASLTERLAARLSRGRHVAHPVQLLACGSAATVLLRSEDSLESTRRNLTAAGADLDRIHVLGPGGGAGGEAGPPFLLPESLEALAALVEREQARLIALKRYTSASSGGSRSRIHHPFQSPRTARPLCV